MKFTIINDKDFYYNFHFMEYFLKKNFYKQIGLIKFSICLSVFYCVTILSLEFINVPISNFYSFVNVLAHWTIISFCSCGLFFLLTVNRIVFTILYPFIFILSVVLCYFNLTINVSITPQVIELSLVNGVDMWWTMISAKLVILILISLIFSILVVAIRCKYVITKKYETLLCLVVGVIILCVPYGVKRLNRPVYSRLPFSIFSSFSEYLENRKTISEVRNDFDYVTVKTSENNSPDVIFIIGESLRADHIPFNGYTRNTMPILSNDTNVISFPNIYSKYTATHTSVPHIMTRCSIDEEEAYNSQSFITIFKKAGYKTTWIANQDLANTYTYFAHECDTLIICNSGSMYSYSEWLDTSTLPFVEKELSKNNNSPKLVIIHSIGSHWWYKSHYSKNHTLFLPEIQHKEVSGLSKEEMINSYDNTIVATDEFISGICNIIRNRNAILIYLSDHGELLGENGQYLHGGEGKELHYPACFFWSTKEYEDNNYLKIDKLKENRLKCWKTDFLFHTIIDAANIQTTVVDTSLSVMR